MSQQSERVCSLVDVPVIVRVDHGHLDPIYRVEELAQSREKLMITLRVSWLAEKIDDFDALFNYARLYSLLQDLHDTKISGPIEEFIDSVFARLEAEALAQSIKLRKISLLLKRPDLLQGYVQLERHTDYGMLASTAS